ncbi:Cytosolic 5'-nucleotidase 3A [Entomophthora muscae]|uniref:Cytosolic 5'-nucleotidase 3A n=1 Tax=Entomophthora muscae TaxID=34485 RepID=A0ACC2SIW5_9FUNG|nr:Cytosolic 5'-nucleotidase 3A [Entomophthora muscae]
MTLTKFWTNNKQNCDTFNVLEAVGLVSSSLTEAQAQLRKEYRHIELKPEMAYPEKEPLLTEIIRKNNELYIDEKFTKHQLQEALQDYPIVYRDGARDLVTLTSLHQIPVLVFSAGLGGN